jgi:hypothetical protein
MFDLVKSAYTWITQQAFHQLIALLLLSIICFIVLLKYPISFERVSYTNKDHICITKTSQYIVRSSASKDGAKLKLCTQTYFVEVRKENDN